MEKYHGTNPNYQDQKSKEMAREAAEYNRKWEELEQAGDFDSIPLEEKLKNQTIMAQDQSAADTKVNDSKDDSEKQQVRSSERDYQDHHEGVILNPNTGRTAYSGTNPGHQDLKSKQQAEDAAKYNRKWEKLEKDGDFDSVIDEEAA